MSKTIDILAALYGKINNGTASDEEKVRYESMILMSCMDEDALMKAVKQRAKELGDK